MAANEKRVIVFDIDGTLANAEHRLHHLQGGRKNWGAFFAAAGEDPPHDEIVYLNHLLARDPANVILIVTGRPDSMREQTVEWLARHDIEYRELLLRDASDRRSDVVIKAEILDDISARYGKPALVFEDRARVVDMWRENGIRCLQVAPGDF